jgi:hypothetical protein
MLATLFSLVLGTNVSEEYTASVFRVEMNKLRKMLGGMNRLRSTVAYQSLGWGREGQLLQDEVEARKSSFKNQKRLKTRPGKNLVLLQVVNMMIPLLAPEKTIFPIHFVGMYLDLYRCPVDLVPVSGSPPGNRCPSAGWIGPSLFCVLL